MTKIRFLPLRTLRRTSQKEAPSEKITSKNLLNAYADSFHLGNSGTSHVANTASNSKGPIIMFAYLAWIFLRIDMFGHDQDQDINSTDLQHSNDYGDTVMQPWEH